MTSPRYRFGIFEFDARTRELRRDGKIIRLQLQPAQVLSCLLDHAGDTVSRDDLRAAVWGAETFVDFDRGLNFCVAHLRSALDDDTVSPRFIRTFPRRGYQFIAPVQRLDASTSESPGTARQPKPAAVNLANPTQPTRKFSATTLALACAATAILVLSLGSAYMLAARRASKRHPTIAVVRFDNETLDPRLAAFSDALTDGLVEQLTSRSLGRYEVIGNAHVLRLPRDQRDLAAIASSFHARYVVLGQIQSAGAQTRILAHLIRLPEQTHLWVERIDRSLADPLAIESEVTQKIAADFSQRVVADSTGAPLSQFPNH
ncbi:MAG: winged helix-turn-helix domain-containing protein [Candidatus Acidiferrum sp.]